MRVETEHQNMFGSWKHYQIKQNEADVFHFASRRAQTRGKKHRLPSADGSFLNLISAEAPGALHAGGTM